jgi:hypothetical protein
MTGRDVKRIARTVFNLVPVVHPDHLPSSRNMAGVESLA